MKVKCWVDETGVDETVDETVVDETGVDELGCYPAPTILNDQGVTKLVNVGNLGSIPVKQQHSPLIL